MDSESISEARANLTELVTSVRLLRRCVLLTRRDKPQAGIVTADLAIAADDVGGADIATRILRDHLAHQQD